MFKLLKLVFWLPVFWFIAGAVAHELDLGGLFLTVALTAGTAVAVWVSSSGDGKESAS